MYNKGLTIRLDSFWHQIAIINPYSLLNYFQPTMKMLVHQSICKHHLQPSLFIRYP
jgi:hypothetical protein